MAVRPTLGRSNRLVRRAMRHRTITTLFPAPANGPAPADPRSPAAAARGGTIDRTPAYIAIPLLTETAGTGDPLVPSLADVTALTAQPIPDGPAYGPATTPLAEQPLSGSPLPPVAPTRPTAATTPVRATPQTPSPAPPPAGPASEAEQATALPQAEGDPETDTPLTDQVWQRLQTIFQRHRSREDEVEVAPQAAPRPEAGPPATVPPKATATSAPGSPRPPRGRQVTTPAAGEASPPPQTVQRTPIADPPAPVSTQPGARSRRPVITEMPPSPAAAVIESGPEAESVPYPLPENREQPEFPHAEATVIVAPSVVAPDAGSGLAATRRETGSGGDVTQVADTAGVADRQAGPGESPAPTGTATTPRVEQPETAGPTLGEVDSLPPAQVAHAPLTSFPTAPEHDLGTVAGSAVALEVTPPLHEVWAVERVRQAQPVPAVAQAPAGTAGRRPIAPQPVQAQVREVLESVAAARPTESGIEVIPPRRPRPTQTRIVGQPEAQAPPILDRASPPPAPVVPVTPRPSVAAISRQRSTVVMGDEDTETLVPDLTPTPAARMVETGIGALPADLWELIGESPPIGTVAPAGRSGSASEQRTEAVPTTVGVRTPPREQTTQASPPAPRRVPQPTTSSAGPVIQRSVAPATAQAPTSVTASPAAAGESAGGETAQAPTPAVEQDAEAAVDVDKLAHRVYAELKRRLTVEWERVRRR